jgi:hypothetical protein
MYQKMRAALQRLNHALQDISKVNKGAQNDEQSQKEEKL